MDDLVSLYTCANCHLGLVVEEVCVVCTAQGPAGLTRRDVARLLAMSSAKRPICAACLCGISITHRGHELNEKCAGAILKGGQGRSAEETRASAFVTAAALVVGVSVVAALVVWACGHSAWGVR